MAIQAVSSFKVGNSRGRVANYQGSNYMSRMNISNQPVDTFTKSNHASQVTFTGNPLTLIKDGGRLAKTGESILGEAGKKVGGITRRIGEEATEAIGSATRKIKSKNKFPDSKKLQKPQTPQTLNYGVYTTPIIDKLNSWNAKNPCHKITVPGEDDISGCNVAKDKLATYITKYDPSFTGLADVATDLVGEGTIEFGKEIASEAGQFVAEEVIGEAGMQAIERGLDCVLPGAGLILTGARWARRLIKAGEFIDKMK